MFKLRKKKQKNENEDTGIKYLIIELAGPQLVKFYYLPPEELPENFFASYSVEIETGDGRKIPGFIAVRTNLEPLQDVPLIKDFIEKNQLIPLDTRELYKYIGEKTLVELYHNFELVQAGKWGRLAFQKTHEIKKFDWEKAKKWIALAIFIGLAAVGFYIFSPMLFSSGSGHAQTSTSGPTQTPTKGTIVS